MLLIIHNLGTGQYFKVALGNFTALRLQLQHPIFLPPLTAPLKILQRRSTVDIKLRNSFSTILVLALGFFSEFYLNCTGGPTEKGLSPAFTSFTNIKFHTWRFSLHITTFLNLLLSLKLFIFDIGAKGSILFTRVSMLLLTWCYGTALIFHFFSLFGLVDIIIRFKGENMVNTCCSTAHGFLMFNCALLRTSWLPHVEYSRTTYIRIPRDASRITHVFHLVYIVYQIAY